jgi:hypothetical protein
MEILPTLHHTEKSDAILPSSQLESCLHDSAEWTGEHHTPCTTHLPIPQENNPDPGQNELLPAKIKSINSEL